MHIGACGYPDRVELWVGQHLLIGAIYFNVIVLVLLSSPGKLVLFGAANSDNICTRDPIY
jgi:hypothetical protein